MKFIAVVLAAVLRALSGMAVAGPLERRAGEESVKRSVRPDLEHFGFDRLCGKFQGDKKNDLCKRAILECDRPIGVDSDFTDHLRRLSPCVDRLASLEIPDKNRYAQERVCYFIPQNRCQDKVDACAREQNVASGEGLQRENWPAFIRCMDESRLSFPFLPGDGVSRGRWDKVEGY